MTVLLQDFDWQTLCWFLAMAVLLVGQIWLCFRVRSRILRWLPSVLFALATLACVIVTVNITGWDAFGWLILSVVAAALLGVSLLGWAVYGVVCLVKRIRAK